MMRGAWFVAFGVVWLTSSVAHADAGEVCSSAYARGQQERLAGRLYTARAAFIECSASACPAATAADCARWRAEVEADLPTVRIAVKNEHGESVPELRVFADGVSIPLAQLAAPVILEAGPHELRFEAPGYVPIELEKALRPSDREVEVAVVMRAPVLAEAVPRPASKRIPPASIAFAGVGVLALGTAAYFGLSARSRYNDLEGECAPRCSQADADSVYHRALASDIALAVGVASVAASLFFYLSRPTPTQPALRLQPRLGGAQLGFSASF